jgi:hypothetical protein
MNETEEAAEHMWARAVNEQRVCAFDAGWVTWVIAPRRVGWDKEGRFACTFVALDNDPQRPHHKQEHTENARQFHTRTVASAPFFLDPTPARAAAARAARALAMPPAHRSRIVRVLAEN